MTPFNIIMYKVPLKGSKRYRIIQFVYDKDSPELTAEEIRKGADEMRWKQEKVMVSVRLEKHTAEFYI